MALGGLVIGSFARETYITPSWLDDWSEKNKGPNGRCLCKRCGKEVQKPRRYWCSQECIDELNRQSGSPRKLAHKRDEGICAHCGLDCDRLERVLRELALRHRERTRWVHKCKNTDADVKKYYKQTVFWRWANHKYPWAFGKWQEVKHIWEADHKKPVIEGGGEIGMGNIRTLCVPCHRVETKKLHQRLTKRRARV